MILNGAGDIYAGSYVIGLQTGQSPETLIERQGGGLPYTDPDGVNRNVGVILDGVYENGVPNDKVVHYYFKYIPNAGGWGRFLQTRNYRKLLDKDARIVFVVFYPGKNSGKDTGFSGT
ncbi:MAG: hypothetical protein R3B93_13975 [Bacteroidia bacterium]